MSGNQYPSDVQFAGLIQAATAAADARERNASILGKRRRSHDDSLIDTQLREQSDDPMKNVGQLQSDFPLLQSSASVLFREPSEKSKKYSRPPLGKVYHDLQLAPETFLRLQNAAKTYMLDEDHMERRDVVGHKKHSSQNDVAKLRLWGCVEEFLEQDNNGETWFGPDAHLGIPDSPHRSFVWPDDKHKIIKLCMPLFRKMVTNERQRLYASETRKQDPSKVDKSAKAGIGTSQPEENPGSHQVSANETLAINSTIQTPHPISEMFAVDDHQQHSLNGVSNLTLLVNIISREGDSTHRLVPRFSISSNSITSLPALIDEARKKYNFNLSNDNSDDGGWSTAVVKVWLPDGLIHIKDDGQWMVALLSASMVDWMDSEIRVLIEVGTAPEVITLGRSTEI